LSTSRFKQPCFPNAFARLVNWCGATGGRSSAATGLLAIGSRIKRMHRI
jgi:hypothetical protein